MDYEKLKEVIAKKIKENGREEITGPVLQMVLMAMVDSLGEVYPQTYTEEQKAQARANIDALSDYDGAITKEKLSAEVQAILEDVPNKQNITDESLATIAKTIIGAINEVYNGGLKDASIATSKIEDGAITEPKLDTDLVNVINSAVQPAELASALASYVPKADILDTTGSATDKVMSQHGVTEAINGVNNKVTELSEEVGSVENVTNTYDKSSLTQGVGYNGESANIADAVVNTGQFFSKVFQVRDGDYVHIVTDGANNNFPAIILYDAGGNKVGTKWSNSYGEIDSIDDFFIPKGVTSIAVNCYYQTIDNFVLTITASPYGLAAEVVKLSRAVNELENLEGIVAESERALNMQPTEVFLDKAFLSGYITGTGYFSTINQGKTYGLYYIPVKKGETYRAIGMYAKFEASYAGIAFCEVLPTTAGNYGAIVLETVGNATPIDYQYVADKDGYLYVFIYDSTGYVNFFGYKPKTTFNAEYVEDNALKTEAAIFNQEFSFIQGEALKANGDIWLNLAASFARTDYIDIRGYRYLSYQLASNDVVENICFYDANKVFVSSIKLPSGLNTSFIDLSEHPNAKYIRCATTDFKYHRDSGYIYVKLMAYPYKPSQYKKMLNIGDSLTRTSRWAIHVCDYCHIPTYSQKASSGATMAKRGNDSIYDAVQALTAEDDVDLVTIWAGTNDFGSSVEIGDFDVQANAATRDVTTFYGAYMASVEKVLSLYPRARIILIGTTPRTWANGEGDYNTTTIGGKYLREYVDAVKKIAEWYGLPFLDLLRTSGINSKNIAEYMYPQTGSDGTYYLHFSDYGTKQIAKRIAAFIESVG